MIPYNQLSLADIFSDCQEIYESHKPQFLFLLRQYIDLDEIVPVSFRKYFYASTSRTRKYPLNVFMGAYHSACFFNPYRFPHPYLTMPLQISTLSSFTLMNIFVMLTNLVL